jgi:hypothetical protein
MLGDFCRGIPTNLFTLADYRRDDGIWNRKGQLHLAEDFTVERPKQAWQAARHAFSLLDATWTHDLSARPTAPSGVSAFTLRGPGGARIVAWWKSGSSPTDTLMASAASVAAPGTAADELVAMDVRSGAVWRLPPIAADGTVRAPLYDSPVLIGPRRVFPLAGSLFAVQVNFQPASAPTVSGYAVDAGAVFGARTGGLTYGWNASVADTVRDRQTIADQLRDTVVHLQKSKVPDARWEIAVPNGIYEVHAVSGDPDHYDSVFRIDAEGVRLVDGTPTSANRFIEGTAVVTVSDGRLTLTNGTGSKNNKLCFLEIVQLPSGIN